MWKFSAERQNVSSAPTWKGRVRGGCARSAVVVQVKLLEAHLEISTALLSIDSAGAGKDRIFRGHTTTIDGRVEAHRDVGVVGPGSEEETEP